MGVYFSAQTDTDQEFFVIIRQTVRRFDDARRFRVGRSMTRSAALVGSGTAWSLDPILSSASFTGTARYGKQLQLAMVCAVLSRQVPASGTY